MSSPQNAETQPAPGASAVRRAYETEGVYSVGTICRKVHIGASEYVDELLVDKLRIIRRQLGRGLVVDLCCGTGDHLFDLCSEAQSGLGLDFSRPFIAKARLTANERGCGHVSFAVADALHMPLRDRSVGTLYCLSALYQVSDVESVFAEVARVLARGGRAILDLGNAHSLNVIVARAYPELPPLKAISVAKMLDFCCRHGLIVIEHRSFQILPLWANKPFWLSPLLHPVWKRLMKKRIKGKMIDEWISSCWPFRNFAFRHLLVVECVKP